MQMSVQAQAEQSLPEPAMDVGVLLQGGLPRLEPVLVQLRRQLQRRHRRLRRVPAVQQLLLTLAATATATATGPHVPPRERPRVNSHHLAGLLLLVLPPSKSRVLFFHRSQPHKQVHSDSGADNFWNRGSIT